MAPEEPPRGAGSREEPIVRSVDRRVIDLRLANPETLGVDMDLVLMAFLLETSRFGLSSSCCLTFHVL